MKRTVFILFSQPCRCCDATCPCGQVPYFLIHKEGLARDGSTPTLLYGYGGFEISLLPSYQGVIGASWLETGGAYVMANIRGGGEFGPAWHQVT